MEHREWYNLESDPFNEDNWGELLREINKTIDSYKDEHSKIVHNYCRDLELLTGRVVTYSGNYFINQERTHDERDIKLKLKQHRMIHRSVSNQLLMKMNKPQFVTEDGDIEMQQRRDKLQMLSDYIIAREGRPSLKLTLETAVLSGFSWVQFVVDADDIFLDHCRLYELLLDYRAARHGRPSDYHRMKWRPAAQLVREFPDVDPDIFYTALEAGSSTQDSYVTPYPGAVLLRDHYYCDPDGDGLRVLSVDNAIIDVMKWEVKKSVFIPLSLDDNGEGPFSAQGMMERAAPLAIFTNLMHERFSQAAAMTGVTLLDYSQGGHPIEVNDLPVSIVRMGPNARPGREIEALTMPAFNPQAHQITNESLGHMLSNEGMSSVTALGDQPHSRTPQRSLRMQNDFTRINLYHYFENLEAFIKEVAATMVECCRVYGHKIKAANKQQGTYKEIDFKRDANIEDNKFVIDIYTSNLFADTPGARHQDITEFVTNSPLQIHPARIAKAYDNPDVKDILTDELAPYALIEKQLYQIVSGAEDPQLAPDGLQELEYAARRGAQEYSKYCMNSVIDPIIKTNLQQYTLSAQRLAYERAAREVNKQRQLTESQSTAPGSQPESSTPNKPEQGPPVPGQTPL